MARYSVEEIEKRFKEDPEFQKSVIKVIIKAMFKDPECRKMLGLDKGG